MKSMTGYAFKELRNEELSASVEIKGYNNRFLELQISLPPYCSGLEPAIREFLARRIRRGKIELGLRLREHNAEITVSVNEGAVRAYEKAVTFLSRAFNLEKHLSLNSLLSLEGVLDIEKNRDDRKYWDYVEPLLGAALEQFEEERRREGRHTEEDILARLGEIENGVKAIAAQAPALETALRENLRARFAELLGEAVDENRVLAETASLLVKYSISEELSRLDAHLKEFRRETERNPSPGKKLDFLCQEINREINTIGSKTPALEVSRAVVEMKNALEDIREQLHNIE